MIIFVILLWTVFSINFFLFFNLHFESRKYSLKSFGAMIFFNALDSALWVIFWHNGEYTNWRSEFGAWTKTPSQLKTGLGQSGSFFLFFQEPKTAKRNNAQPCSWTNFRRKLQNQDRSDLMICWNRFRLTQIITTQKNFFWTKWSSL